MALALRAESQGLRQLVTTGGQACAGGILKRWVPILCDHGGHLSCHRLHLSHSFSFRLQQLYCNPAITKTALVTSSLSLDPTLPPAASAWLPGTLELSGQLFVFDGGVPVPGSATAMRLPTCEYCVEVRCAGALFWESCNRVRYARSAAKC